MAAEKAEQPPKPVRKAKKHKRATPSEPFPFSYAVKLKDKSVQISRAIGASRRTNIDGIVSYCKGHCSQQSCGSWTFSIGQQP